MLTHHKNLPSYTTKDGSTIRELMHPTLHGSQNQSLAEATVPPQTTTLLHRHQKTEEIYHITTGHGLMTLGKEQFEVSPGDTILISPGTPHCIRNTGEQNLTILCSCAPAYSHEDTELLGE
jgi:mannose-6-phosphate isomerase-like protein (cupin superfamily)